MQFTFRVKRKAAYERGTIVFGKILSGTIDKDKDVLVSCLLYTSPSPRDS